jgi:four helix bundle protein
MSGRSFMELDSWKKGRALRKEMKILSDSFPSEEKYKLCDQLIRSSRSVTANIAEGHGRFHYKENAQYCRMSRGSATECIDHLSVALDCNYIDRKDFLDYQNKYEDVIKILNGYIRFLLKQKDKGK